MTRFPGASASIKMCVLLLTSCASSAALADHVGPSGDSGAGASLHVLSPDALEVGKVSLGLRLTYMRPDQRSDEELEALAGPHIHAHNTDYNLNAAVGVAYGLTDRLTVSAEIPYLYRDQLREGEHSHVGGQTTNEVVQLGSVSGVGDVSIIAKYKLTAAENSKFAVIGGLKMPTGSTHRHSNEGERLETEHQPGSGSWDPLVGAAFGTRLGPVSVNASALYQWSGKGAQETTLGDRVVGGIALSHRFGPTEHHHQEAEHHHFEDDAQAEHGHASWDAFVELTGEWEGRQKVEGVIEQESGGKSVWLSPGARFSTASGFFVAASFGLPIWQHIRSSHPDNDYRITLAVGKAF